MAAPDSRRDSGGTTAGAARRRCGPARPPTPVDVYGPVLEPGEHALLSTEIGYSRYCGSNARYSPLPLIVAGRPAVMFGALAVQGVVNHRRKVAAERKAAEQWRFHQTCAVIVTTDRLICSTAPHGQVEFLVRGMHRVLPGLTAVDIDTGLRLDISGATHRARRAGAELVERLRRAWGRLD